MDREFSELRRDLQFTNALLKELIRAIDVTNKEQCDKIEKLTKITEEIYKRNMKTEHLKYKEMRLQSDYLLEIIKPER